MQRSLNDGYAVSGSVIIPTGMALTDAGAYVSAPGPYGTFDQGGNVWEWNEALVSGSFRSLRGGSWDNASGSLQSSSRNIDNPSGEVSVFGFRVASVPEPGTGVLAIVACGMLWWWRKRFK